ncbi:unnamed protein product [Strongylus vulgaris]|uniref:Uncharacterized protein n=1 Tax=Strongylus vulgaris TaxID=40348 RepID=A0A3P7IQ77_STRVU|nr:unnamed protein product [Strongylus vulgaris]
MRREFTIIFTTITVLPLTIKTGLTAFHTAVIVAIDFPNRKVVDALYIAEIVFETTTCFTFMTGSTIFAYVAIQTSRTQKSPRNTTFMSILHINLLIILCALSIMDVFPPQFSDFKYSTISPLVFLIVLVGAGSFMVILVMMILMTGMAEACNCGKRVIVESRDPVVFNSLARMFWTIPLMIAAGLFALIDYVGKRSPDPYLSTISITLLPSCILLAQFLLIPAYRTAIFCCCANNRLQNRVVPTTLIMRPLATPTSASPPGKIMTPVAT